MKKLFILSLMLITSLCSRNLAGKNQVKVENVVEEQQIESAVLNTEITENEVIEEEIESELNQESDEKIDSEIKVNETQDTPKTSPNKTVKTAIETPSQNAQPEKVEVRESIQSVNNPQTSVEIVENNEPVNNQPVESNTPVNNAPVENHDPTPSDLEYWCVSGGSHHIEGDGANEYGYYNSWDEAEQAFQAYTADWNSFNYKILQCPCGKFYFRAIQ